MLLSVGDPGLQFGTCAFSSSKEFWTSTTLGGAVSVVAGEVDRSHATLTEFGLDAVAAFEGCVQADDGIVISHAG